MSHNITGMILFGDLNDFRYFPLNVAGHGSEQVKNDHFERGCRWFQLFVLLISFILFSNHDHP